MVCQTFIHKASKPTNYSNSNALQIAPYAGQYTQQCKRQLKDDRDFERRCIELCSGCLAREVVDEEMMLNARRISKMWVRLYFIAHDTVAFFDLPLNSLTSDSCEIIIEPLWAIEMVEEVASARTGQHCFSEGPNTSTWSSRLSPCTEASILLLQH